MSLLSLILISLSLGAKPCAYFSDSDYPFTVQEPCVRLHRPAVLGSDAALLFSFQGHNLIV